MKEITNYIIIKSGQSERHEVPVTSEPITVIHMDEDVVVVNKPASIPIRTKIHSPIINLYSIMLNVENIEKFSVQILLRLISRLSTYRHLSELSELFEVL
ncbi:hypothetical protein WN51_14627 [Melipona quadrifasciata]|uniref:Uncharacterized protein n=1 Tax=Melipona quadrifasciata TaxID=166423 RepID=A0A0M8ZXI5_9HYME|nr:hypothetical protein WN51_14627 [Melipona quadrifasciata]